MTASLRALLFGAIDYAGLFPPAALPLDQAIRNYARYRQEPDAWMLGRFVIPADRLAELASYREELFSDCPPFVFSVLGPAGAWAPWGEELREALEQMRLFGADHRGRAVADALELKVPAALFAASEPATTAGRLRELGACIDEAGLSDVSLFLEFGRGGERAVTPALEAVARFNRDCDWRAGFKLRCGGVAASAFPDVEQVAFVIRAAADRRVGLKATAGLHHPIRRHDAALKATMHGFINLFVAVLLAHTRRPDHETLRAVIADENPAHFAFTDDGLRWNGLSVSRDETAAIRRNDLLTSFGSCSFDEPRDDLRALGWM